MAISNRRFTNQDLLQLFVFGVFPIHVWTILNMLRDVPSWGLYMRYGELISTVAYTMTFALLETMIVLLPFGLLGILIPRNWARGRFVPWASVMLVEGAIAAILIQFSIKNATPKRLLVVGILGMMAASTILVFRFPRIQRVLRWLAERLTILSLLYIFLDLVGLAIVIFRNV